MPRACRHDVDATPLLPDFLASLLPVAIIFRLCCLRLLICYHIIFRRHAMIVAVTLAYAIRLFTLRRFDY